MTPANRPPSEDEMNSQYDKAVDASAGGSRWPGMTYEDGVRATLDWVRGDTDQPPMDD